MAQRVPMIYFILPGYKEEGDQDTLYPWGPSLCACAGMHSHGASRPEGPGQKSI